MTVPLTNHLHPPACRSARHDGWIVAFRFTDQGYLRSTISVSITIWGCVEAFGYAAHKGVAALLAAGDAR